MSTDQPTTVEAEPLQRDPADAKAWFYLDYRGDIEQWAALRDAARPLVDRHLLTLSDELDEWADEVGAESYRRDLDSGSYPRLGLTRSTWQHGGLQDLSICVEWERGRLLAPTYSNQWPYVAVRHPASQADPDRRRQVNEALKPWRGGSDGYKGSPTYPLFRYVVVKQDALDPRALVDLCRQELRLLWERTASALDDLHPVVGSNNT